MNIESYNSEIEELSPSLSLLLATNCDFIKSQQTTNSSLLVNGIIEILGRQLRNCSDQLCLEEVGRQILDSVALC